MSNAMALLVLALAALLEAGGDFLVRNGLRSADLTHRIGWIVAGGLILTIYGVTVNVLPWSFGRLLGAYVVLFFIVAQTISYFADHIRPSTPILVGGSLIIAGGLLITFWRTS